jgi:Flp pilus assembly protein TadD
MDSGLLKSDRKHGPLADQVKKVKVTPATCVAVAEVQLQLSRDESRSSIDRDALRENARKALYHALEIDPSYQPAYQSLAKLHLSLHENEKAIEVLKKALHQSPKDAQLWSDIGLIYARERNFSEAISHMQQAVRMEPENRIYLRNLGFLYARSGRYEEAYDVFRRIMSEGQARLYIARMLYQLHQDEACLAQLQLALAADPQLTAAQELLAELQPSQAVRPVTHSEPAGTPSQPPARFRFEPVE